MPIRSIETGRVRKQKTLSFSLVHEVWYLCETPVELPPKQMKSVKNVSVKHVFHQDFKLWQVPTLGYPYVVIGITSVI